MSCDWASGACPPDLQLSQWQRLRRPERCACARLCQVAGGELEQIQLLLGQASVQTAERYLGSEQELRHPVNQGLTSRTLEFFAYCPRTGFLGLA